MQRTVRVVLAALAVLASVLAPTIVHADDGSDLCANRPGLGTPPCTLPAGDIMVELAAVGWERSITPGRRDDSLVHGDALFRAGLGRATEIEIGLGGWTQSFSQAGAISEAASGLGDATFAVRHGFGSETEAKFAVQAYVAVPVGPPPGGAGDWGAGVLLPIALPLPAGFTLTATPEIAAAVNASGRGRHLAWGAVAGLEHALTRAVSLSAEVSAFRDEDPEGAATESRLALAAAWRVSRSLQIDIEVDIGLTPAAPDHALLLGFAHRF